MTARKLLLLTVLGVLALLLGVSIHSSQAAPAKPDFTLAVSPSSQSVTQGSSVTYSVTISRQGGLTAAVALSVSGLPAGAAASFSPASPVAGATTTLTIATTGSTPIGNKSLTLTGTGDGKTRTASFSLNVQPVATPSFNLTVAPSAQTISQDDSTTFGVSIARVNGFSSAVSLSIAGLPKQTTASFSPATIAGPAGTGSTLTLVTAHNSDVGTFPLTVTATGGSVSRTATVTLNVEKKQVFSIEGNASSPLYPGGSAVFDLRLTNPNNFTIRVTQLVVSVEEHTSSPGCSGTANFQTTGLTGGHVDVPGNAGMTLSQLGVAQSRWPKVAFANLASNQDACKSTTVTFQYSGTAVKP